MFIKVDFPAPLGPNIVSSSPFDISKLMSSKAICFLLYIFDSLRIRMPLGTERFFDCSETSIFSFITDS